MDSIHNDFARITASRFRRELQLLRRLQEATTGESILYNISVRYGVTANIAAFHAAARGSIPRIGIFLSLLIYTISVSLWGEEKRRIVIKISGHGGHGVVKRVLKMIFNCNEICIRIGGGGCIVLPSLAINYAALPKSAWYDLQCL